MQVIEAILPPPCVDNNEESSEVAPKSIKESLADEIAALKGHGGNEKSRQSNQRIMSIDVVSILIVLFKLCIHNCSCLILVCLLLL